MHIQMTALYAALLDTAEKAALALRGIKGRYKYSFKLDKECNIIIILLLYIPSSIDSDKKIKVNEGSI